MAIIFRWIGMILSDPPRREAARTSEEACTAPAGTSRSSVPRIPRAAPFSMYPRHGVISIIGARYPISQTD